MATLTQPHWDKVPLALRQIVESIGDLPFTSRFYLAGGTAVALQLGHRISVDLDFFSTTDELWDQSRQEITASLKSRFPLQVAEDTFSTLVFNIQGSSVGFFSYGYPLLASTVPLEGIMLAGLLDLGLMKLDAIATRGARKDFYDLYFIAQHIPLDKLLERGKDKYPFVRDFGMLALTALVDWLLAEQQAPIESFPPVSWEEVKAFCLSEARRIGRKWLKPE